MSTRAVVRAHLFCVILTTISGPLSLNGREPARRGETVPLAQRASVRRAIPVEENLPEPFHPSSINSIARMLGGLSSGGRQGGNSAWPYHQQQMDALWQTHENGRGQSIRSWAATNISDLRQSSSVFYPFSGPDFLFAYELFPYAGSYILCGLEPIDPLPDVATLSQGEIASGLDSLRQSVRDLMLAGYFVSKDMRSMLKSSRFQGVLPVFLALLARTGNSVVAIDSVGSNGVLVRFQSPAGGSRRLYYFKQDLSNGSTKSGGAFLNFVSSHGNPPALIKSASYLMHNNGFSNIRNYLLRDSRAIIQDPSGVPYRDLVAAGFLLHLYGNYQGTLNIFSQQQPDLMDAYRSGRHPVSSVNFGFGYLYNPSTTSIIVARR